jgi:hypothetical protein
MGRCKMWLEGEWGRPEQHRNLLKTKPRARHQWLTPVIPDIQEAEIRKITLANSSRDPILKKKKKIPKKGLWRASRCRH